KGRGSSGQRRPSLRKRERKPLRARLRNVGLGARNALDWIRDGRLGAPYQAQHRIVLETGILKLRHYEPSAAEAGATGGAGAAPGGGGAAAVTQGRPLLLVPPLMVTADVYDISPELSAVIWLAGQGIDVYVADFGVPEIEEGGLARTIDDHVLAVDSAITF